MPSRSYAIRAENINLPRRSPRFLDRISNRDFSRCDTDSNQNLLAGIPPNFKLRTRSSSNRYSKLGLESSVPCLRRSKRFQNHDAIVASGKNSCKTGLTKCTSAKESKACSISRKSNKGCEVTCKKSSRSASSRRRRADRSSRRVSPMFSSQHEIEEAMPKSRCDVLAEKEIDSTGSQFSSGGIMSANSKRDCDKTETKGKRLESSENDETHEGWTKEQEMALNNAYLAAKPTPHFWKSVAKMVPGKSAQECFDKVHSDNITTPQPRPGSRTKQSNSLSSLTQPPLSASKLLKGTGLKTRQITKQNFGKLRSLLQMNCQHPETDLFRLLEPTMDAALTTPNPSLRLRFASGMSSSSSHKRPISRFAASAGANLVSPPVLKPIKNPALHEKYINRLQYRDFKRKSYAAAKEGVRVDAVRGAKNALIFDANDVLYRFGNGESNKESSSSDIDDDMMSLDGDDEGDDLLMGIGFVR